MAELSEVDRFFNPLKNHQKGRSDLKSEYFPVDNLGFSIPIPEEVLELEEKVRQDPEIAISALRNLDEKDYDDYVKNILSKEDKEIENDYMKLEQEVICFKYASDEVIIPYMFIYSDGLGEKKTLRTHNAHGASIERSEFMRDWCVGYLNELLKESSKKQEILA